MSSKKRQSRLWDKGSSGRRPYPRPRLGMTLIELLVVIALVAGIAGAGIYYMGVITNNQLRGEAMRLTSVIKYTYGKAAMNNSQYRLVIDLDSGEYYTEVSESAVVVETPRIAGSDGMLSEEAMALAEQRRSRHDLFAENEQDPFGVNRKVTFEKVQDAVLSPRGLRGGIKFYKVMTHHQDEPFESGRTAISFYPSGFQDQAIIMLQDPKGSVYTLMTEPLTGRVRLYHGERDIPRDFGEVEDAR